MIGHALSYAISLGLLLAVPCVAQRVDVTLHVRFQGSNVALSADTPLVVWLSPLDAPAPPARSSRTYKMEQKQKHFVPNLLVVPVGSTVEFPNLDPFFHNVFSLFNGRRFDLGLYETGKSQAAKFSREGVSYIFCNIHPEMGGIILSLATPYYAVSQTADVTLRGVPPGTYKLAIWHEHATSESLTAAAKVVKVDPAKPDLGEIVLQSSPRNSQPHSNKYGEPYPFPEH